MRISDTAFPFLEEDCIQAFGPEDGRALFEQTEDIYRQLLEGADYRGSEAVRDHLQRKLFPPMACYKALCERGAPAEQALEYVRTRKSALAKRGEMKKPAGMPIAYTICRLGVKNTYQTGCKKRPL